MECDWVPVLGQIKSILEVLHELSTNSLCRYGFQPKCIWNELNNFFLNPQQSNQKTCLLSCYLYLALTHKGFYGVGRKTAQPVSTFITYDVIISSNILFTMFQLVISDTTKHRGKFYGTARVLPKYCIIENIFCSDRQEFYLYSHKNKQFSNF